MPSASSGTLYICFVTFRDQWTCIPRPSNSSLDHSRVVSGTCCSHSTPGIWTTLPQKAWARRVNWKFENKLLVRQRMKGCSFKLSGWSQGTKRIIKLNRIEFLHLLTSKSMPAHKAILFSTYFPCNLFFPRSLQISSPPPGARL